MPFELGKTFHLIHITDDYEELSAWYADVFDGLDHWVRMRDHFPYLDVEIRWADLVIIGDACVEPMAPAKEKEGWDQAPVGRFLNKFGPRWQTMSWYTEGVDDLYQQLKERDTRFFLLGGGSGDEGLEGDVRAFFTHPRDTYGGLEFASYLDDGSLPHRPATGDPRFYPGFDQDWWAKNHPLGIRRLAYMTVVVDDLDGATDFYTGGLNGKIIDKSSSTVTGTENVYVALGTDTVVELAKPSGGESVAADDLGRNGAVFHGVTWNVRDLDQARIHLESKGVTVLDSDGSTLTTDPSTTYGAVHRFTTWTPDGDPRD